ncbi:hypothetical protein BRCON_2822 [Candidatus Sumerlaea chitinivorans]|uniref:Uncharacterized protein n=1 Tax=Sumerlaea chitinivorans TaxID=2250252 RepID=A0A2Z4Y8J3_SUMC1|nr:hypothetical protein BRCON_2822 [Candidatus Sumerlaea chitinivorans]
MRMRSQVELNWLSGQKHLTASPVIWAQLGTGTKPLSMARFPAVGISLHLMAKAFQP